MHKLFKMNNLAYCETEACLNLSFASKQKSRGFQISDEVRGQGLMREEIHVVLQYNVSVQSPRISMHWRSDGGACRHQLPSFRKLN